MSLEVGVIQNMNEIRWCMQMNKKKNCAFCKYRAALNEKLYQIFFLAPPYDKKHKLVKTFFVCPDCYEKELIIMLGKMNK